MSKIERKYKDYYGNARSLFWMVRNEPQWAESRILCCESAEAELETLQAQLAAKEAELAQAREALKEIAEWNYLSGLEAGDLRKIAREALTCQT